MPVPALFGVDARAGGAPPYVKPTMVRTGAVGTITSNTAGYSLVGFDDNTFAYLNAGKTTGKWYWEAIAQNYTLTGVTDSPATTRAFGGYATFNAGVYEFVPDPWNQYGAHPAWSGGAIVPGDVLGFALDVGGKTLSIYRNNALGVTLPLTSIGGTIYPLFGFQGLPTQQVNLGFGHTAYGAPAGFAYI